MRVLVTGGAGYIGSLVVEELLKNGHKPVVFDLFNWGKVSIQAFDGKIELFEGDCRNSRDIIYALEGIDGIIHLAGIVGEFACQSNHKAHFSINVESTRTLINCCTDPELELVRDFVYASSCSVYGNVKGLYQEVTEDTPVAPLSDYAHAKLRSENIILDKGRQLSHFHPTILRLTTVFGWSHRPRLDLVTNLFAYTAWKQGKMSIFGDGLQYRSLIHVRDIARALVQTLEAPRYMRDGKIFHLGEESNNRTVKEIAEAVQKIIPNAEILMSDSKPSDRRDYKINCQKIKNIIGWQAQYSVEDGINELVDKFESMDIDWDSWKYRNNNFKYV
ncbi:MAG: NAD(P)-dependent oxidoreductase [Desulfobacula sp.]|jgi:nucleoside-diphosphate-sugar epimerase|nr:NAD(P)-dependent oxidoreductase [Desulfobacula sp.]